MADPISRISSVPAEPPLVFGADFVERYLGERRVEINRINREQWAKESPISYQIHVFTEPFFKAIMPKSTEGRVICWISGCAGFAATLFSMQLAIPTLLLHLGISRIVTKTEKQEV